MRVRGTRRLIRLAALGAAAVAVGVAVPAASAPLPARYLLVTVTPEAGQTLPSAARFAEVTSALEAQGLTVTRGPGLLLQAHGRAAPRLTGALASDVAGVVDSSVGSVRWKAHAGAPVIGSDLLQAYGVPSAPLAPTAPPAITGRTPVVASIQLSGWNATDLSIFAATQGIGDGHALFSSAAQPCQLTQPSICYDPVKSGQYTAVAVDRQPTITQADSQADSEAEVALDQETLLAVAPKLAQRAYFATNGGPTTTTTGILGAFNAVLADVTDGYPIVALTTSWGNCEDGSLAFDELRTSLETTLQKLNAAGVTVFAASGDAGAYDCAPDQGGVGSNPLDPAYSTPAVDYPCSSPWVECVGGTSHPNGSSAPAPDTAWDEGDADTPYKGSGSGGGASTVFPRPSWQAGEPGPAHRLVPDLALDGDPSTGIRTIVDGSPHVIGGTSLAAPTAAAMLSDIVSAAYPSCALPKGVGDIHTALYSNPGAFVDVVAPSSSSAIQPAGPGFDEATGLGTPTWAALAPSLFPLLAPAVCVTSWKRDAGTTTTTITARWAASGAAGIKSIGVAVVSSNPHDAVFKKALPAAARSFRFTGKPGRTYSVAVAAIDNAGHLNVNVADTDVTLPFDDKANQLSKAWSH
ncbi:MAG TPA: hypothetical protein VHE83_12535, partial [Mycobacteriales bacterium]|nr:hypothetical protein [Mycobacteriales bacterium]